MYLGSPPLARDILLFFRGDVGLYRLHDTTCLYSRCIRQTLYKMAREGSWYDRHRIMIGTREDFPGDYSELVSRYTYVYIFIYIRD